MKNTHITLKKNFVVLAAAFTLMALPLQLNFSNSADKTSFLSMNQANALPIIIVVPNKLKPKANQTCSRDFNDNYEVIGWQCVIL